MSEQLSNKRLEYFASGCGLGPLDEQLTHRELVGIASELLELRSKLAEWPWPLDAGLSWSGFGIAGDEKSIDAVKRLISVDARSEDLQKIVLEQRAKLATGPVMPEVPSEDVLRFGATRPFVGGSPIECFYHGFRDALLAEQNGAGGVE